MLAPDVAELRRRALCARSIYHLASVHFQAQASRLHGNGVDQVCLTLPASELIADLARASGTIPTKVAEIVSVLTYGTGLTTPDPALQPIIPVGPKAVAAPAHLIASANYERNLLSLHTRLQPESFNAESSVFETVMTNELLGPCKNVSPL